jgi:hypothetical protein
MSAFLIVPGEIALNKFKTLPGIFMYQRRVLCTLYGAFDF